MQNCVLCNDGDVCKTVCNAMAVMCAKCVLCNDGDVCKTVCNAMTVMCAKLSVIR